MNMMTTLNKKAVLRLAMTAALAGAFTHADAGFILEQPAAAPKRLDVEASVVAPTGSAVVTTNGRQRVDLEGSMQPRIVQSGTPQTQIAFIKGFGTDVKLIDALRQILPAGWHAYTEGQVDAEKKVTWYGNRTWVAALNTALNAQNLQAKIDWNAKEVTVSNMASQVGNSRSAEDQIAIAQALMKVQSRPDGEKAVLAAVKVAAVQEKKSEPAPIWELTSEKTLRENLKAWAEKASWTLIWSAAHGNVIIDYPVSASVRFNGELVGKDGAIARVVSAYKDADNPLEVEFFRANKVIEVRLHSPATAAFSAK